MGSSLPCKSLWGNKMRNRPWRRLFSTELPRPHDLAQQIFILLHAKQQCHESEALWMIAGSSVQTTRDFAHDTFHCFFSRGPSTPLNHSQSGCFLKQHDTMTNRNFTKSIPTKQKFSGSSQRRDCLPPTTGLNCCWHCGIIMPVSNVYLVYEEHHVARRLLPQLPLCNPGHVWVLHPRSWRLQADYRLQFLCLGLHRFGLSDDRRPGLKLVVKKVWAVRVCLPTHKRSFVRLVALKGNTVVWFCC